MKYQIQKVQLELHKAGDTVTIELPGAAQVFTATHTASGLWISMLVSVQQDYKQTRKRTFELLATDSTIELNHCESERLYFLASFSTINAGYLLYLFERVSRVSPFQERIRNYLKDQQQ